MLYSNLFLLGLALVHSCNGFATTKKFATLLDLFKDTKFHDMQISTALCLTQYEYLRRNYGFNESKPNMWDKCPYFEWSQKSNIGPSFDWRHLEEIKATFEAAVAEPDITVTAIPTDHFSLESYISETNYQLVVARQNLIQALQGPSPTLSNIRRTLGKMIHTVQDFYSNTNWIELSEGHDDEINKNVGMNENLGVEINDGIACNPCSKKFSIDEQSEIDEAYATAGGHATALNEIGKKENIFSCTYNLATKLLTSGYQSNEANYSPGGKFPVGKCSFGGVTDDFSTHNPTGGINKDSDIVIFSPHYNLHQKAANLSVQATLQYFEDLRISLDNENLFGELIGFEIASTMSIMIDTTGSMSGSIEAVKKFAQKMVSDSANKTSQYFMTPFNDPKWGPVSSFTNPKAMVDYIGTLGADGGGDTPEKCFSALLDTVRAVPQGTNIYIFTDANSKNPELYPSIVAIASRKSLSINFLMSGETIGRRLKANGNYGNLHIRDIDESETSTSIEDYRRLTIATDGQYFVSLGNEINNATAVITDKNWQTIILLSNISKSLNQSFFVDGSVDGVEISLSSSESYLSTLVVDIIDGNGDSVIMHGSAIIDNQNSKIYRFLINSTVSSPWTLIIENDRYLIDQITIRVQSSLTTNLMLVNSISQKPLIGSPLANEGYDIYVICEDCIDITDISVSTCGNFNISNISSSSQIPTKSGTGCPKKSGGDVAILKWFHLKMFCCVDYYNPIGGTLSPKYHILETFASRVLAPTSFETPVFWTFCRSKEKKSERDIKKICLVDQIAH